MQSTVEDSVDTKPEMPIRFLELTKLTSKDVATSAVGFNNCDVNMGDHVQKLQSDHYITVNETADDPLYARVVIIELKNGNKTRRLQLTADSVIMHWNRNIIAATTDRRFLQIIDIGKPQPQTIKSWAASEKFILLKWISKFTIGLVTGGRVYHWNVFDADQNEPHEVFELTDYMKECEIIDYQVDADGRWMVLTGHLFMDRRIAGRMQLFSVDRGVSQNIEGHASTFSSIRLDAAVIDTKLFIFAVRTATGAKLQIVEYDQPDNGPNFTKKIVDIWYPPEVLGDFPTAVLVSKKYGVIFVVTKYGFAHLYELETGVVFYTFRLSSSTVFTTTPTSDSTGFIGINSHGQVLSVTIDTTTVIPYLLGSNGMDVALQLSSRARLTGGEDLYITRFNQLLDEGKYSEAAQTAVRSPNGFLRTDKTMEKLKKAPIKPGEMSCILLYFGMILDRDVLNKTETIELSRPVLAQNRKHLMRKWLGEGKLYCSKELGDLVRPYDEDLATAIYSKANVEEESLIDFNGTRQIDETARQSAKIGQHSGKAKVVPPGAVVGVPMPPVKKPVYTANPPPVEKPRTTAHPPPFGQKLPGQEREPTKPETHDALDDFPEIVRDSRLSQATIQQDGGRTYTIHNRGARSRAAARNDIWMRQKLLGQGGFGLVHLEVKQMEKSGQPEYRAVKTFRMKDGHLKIRQTHYVRELEAIAKFSQNKYEEFFVKSLGWYTSPTAIHIAMEYCELGDLKSYLSDRQKCEAGRLPEDQVQEIAFQVLKALSLMHRERFAHRDLKPANILIKAHPPEPWWVKVCDMGLSKRVGNIEESYTVCGTPSFMPPELLDATKTKSVDPYSADMWCFGETIFQTLTGRGTFRNPLDIGRYYDGYADFPTATLKQAGVSQPAVNFLVSIMASNPLERLNADKARKHAWMEADLESLTEKTASMDLQAHVGSFGSFPAGPVEPLDETTIVSGAWTDTIIDHRAVLP